MYDEGTISARNFWALVSFNHMLNQNRPDSIWYMFRYYVIRPGAVIQPISQWMTATEIYDNLNGCSFLNDDNVTVYVEYTDEQERYENQESQEEYNENWQAEWSAWVD